MGNKRASESNEERKERKRQKKEKKDRKRNRRRASEEHLLNVSPDHNAVTPDIRTFSQAASAVSQRPVTSTHDASSALFQTKQLTLTVSLYPSALRDVDAHIHDALSDMLLQYVPDTHGILLCYENVRVDRDATSGAAMGRILQDLPHIHYDVRCDAVLFCPDTSSTLRGTVVECFPSHVSLLVLGHFAAVISSTHLYAEGFTYDDTASVWVYGTHQNSIQPQSQLQFVMEKLHIGGDGTVSMEGKTPIKVNETGG